MKATMMSKLREKECPLENTKHLRVPRYLISSTSLFNFVLARHPRVSIIVVDQRAPIARREEVISPPKGLFILG